MIIAIDPGSELSAYVIWDGISISRKEILPNDMLLSMLNPDGFFEEIDAGLPKGNHLVVEQVRSYGMAVGATTFDTVWWSGRFIQAWSPRSWSMMPRMDVKMHICNTSRAKDTNIRTALIDRFGKPGTVKEPNLTYGEELGNKDAKIVKDQWAAFALAVTWWDKGTSA